MARFNASQACISDASFAEVARMKKQECLLLDEIADLRRDKLAAEAERDAANQRAAALVAECDARVNAANLETKHALDVARIVRDENERLRKSSQNREEAMHRAATEMKRDHKAIMAASDTRMESAKASLEHQSNEATSARAALRTAVEEHNMMAQEYYSTMERFSKMHEELDTERAQNDLLAIEYEQLERELAEQGKHARKRLGSIASERDTLKAALEAHSEDTRAACAQSVKSVNDHLLQTTGELVAVKAQLSVAQRQAEEAQDKMSRSAAQSSALSQQLASLREQSSAKDEEQRAAEKRRAQADAMVEQLTSELGKSRDTVAALHEQREQVQDSLRSQVDWQSYASEAFLEGSAYSKRSVASPQQPYLECANKHLVLSPK